MNNEDKLKICQSCEHHSKDNVDFDCCALMENMLILGFILEQCPDGRWENGN
jgi:hypothetical protein